MNPADRRAVSRAKLTRETVEIGVAGRDDLVGPATAKHFQTKGWNVIATMPAPDSEPELTQLARVLVTRLDVQDAASIQAAVDAGLAKFGRIDALLNNAGYGAYGPLEATSPEKIRRQFDVNVLGLLATTQALLPHFRANRSGIIVNVSSIGGRMTFPLGTLYHGSRFAVEGLSEAMHFELAPLGVRVKIIEPGVIRTDFAGRSFDFSNDPKLAEYQPLVQAFFAALQPLSATASPPELVADVIYRAATDDTDQLRYEAGADAVQLLAGRRGAHDAAFLASIKARFGLGA